MCSGSSLHSVVVSGIFVLSVGAPNIKIVFLLFVDVASQLVLFHWLCVLRVSFCIAGCDLEFLTLVVSWLELSCGWGGWGALSVARFRSAQTMAADGFGSNPDLWRTMLCSNGPQCLGRGEDCQDAHDFSELRVPDETWMSYVLSWKEYRVDRWLGQEMDGQQVRRIQIYYDATNAAAIPAWATGVKLYYKGEELLRGFGLPWDFGLAGDLQLVLPRRRYGWRPFPWWGRLWERLELRRREMEAAYYYMNWDRGLAAMVGKAVSGFPPRLPLANVCSGSEDDEEEAGLPCRTSAAASSRDYGGAAISSASWVAAGSVASISMASGVAASSAYAAAGRSSVYVPVVGSGARVTFGDQAGGGATSLSVSRSSNKMPSFV